MTDENLNEPRALRQLIRGTAAAALATALPPDGHPYASLVEMACTDDASPILLISRLAEHTKSLLADPRGSLLIDATAGRAERLTGARLSLVGSFAPSTDPRLRARYLSRHPAAELYASFGDFAFWKMTVLRAHLVAGFGKIRWIDANDLLDRDDTNTLAQAEADIVAHMNQDHAEAIGLYATRLLGATGAEEWTMTGIDPDGADLRRAGQHLRLPFAAAVRTAEAARAELVRLVRAARATSA